MREPHRWGCRFGPALPVPAIPMRFSGLLFAFVLLSLAFAATPPPQVSLPSLDPAENPGFIGAIVLLSIGFVAIAYAVSTSIQNPSAIAWSKDMLRETIVGVIIIVIVYGAVVTANSLISGITGHDNAVELGDASLAGVLSDLKIVYGKIGEAYFSVAAQQGTSISVTFGLPPMKFFFMQPAIYYARDMMPYYGMMSVLQSLNQAGFQISAQILSFNMVKVFLQYIAAVVPQFLLPIGMVLRVFPFTKKAGDTVLALSLGALFMFPASLIVVNEIYLLSDMPHVQAAKSENFADNMDETLFGDTGDLLVRGVCESTAAKIIFGFGELFWGLVYAIIMLLLQNYDFFGNFNTFVSNIWPWIIYALQTFYAAMLTGIAESMSSEQAYDKTILPIASILLPAVSEITMFSAISLVVIAMITYTGTKAISTALGGEYSFYGLSRLM